MADNSELSAKHDPSIFSSKFTAKETQVPWFIPTVPEPPPEFRALLEANGILPSKVRQHIQTVRDKAWAIHTYPCIGENYFLKPFIQKHPALQNVRTMLQGPESRLIDIGCGFGQDLRFLAANVGIDSTQLSGLDLDQEMIDLGYELFNDRNTGTFDAHFETGDMLKLSSTHAHLTNKFDVVHATCALHLFDHDTQVLACENVLRLLKPGGLLLGSQVGRTTVTTLANGMYLNNETSFAELFKKASGKVGVQCEVDSQLLPFEHELMSTIRVDPELRLFVFSVKTKVSQ